MTDRTPVPRRYSDDEVRRLLERAAELQHTDPSVPESGLTLPQLESIAREAGIDVAAVRRAAVELETGAVARPPGWGAKVAGEPLTVTLERAVPGEASAEALESLIPLIQAAADTSGQPSLAGRTLTWQGRDPSNVRELQVMVTARNDETRVRIQERYGGLAGAVFGSGVGGIGGGVGFGVGLGVGLGIGSTLMAVAFPITVLGLTYLGSRAVYGSVVRRRRETLDRLMLEIIESLPADAPALPEAEDRDR
jgi:hypothetical protein